MQTQLSFFDVLDRFSKESTDNVKFKYRFCREKLSNEEKDLISWLIDNDRSFVLAPEYDYDINKLIEDKGQLTLEETAKYLNISISEVDKTEKKFQEVLRKRCGFDQLRRKKRTRTKELKMAKRGQKTFKTQKEAMRFVVHSVASHDLPRTLVVVEDLKKVEKPYFIENLVHACEMVGRVDSETGTVNLDNLPTIKRGRPSREETS